MTEQRLAAAFREARHEDSVLLIDEADSFLRNRDQARQSWEVTLVNEMLTQMEAFEGIFIASTNLMNMLDTAALRRFDMKIRFGFLKAEGAWQLFVEALQVLSLPREGITPKQIAQLHTLTPGDFATVARQSRMAQITSATEFLRRLTAECSLKEEFSAKRIGFI
jgi:transitional endoplasmic reticulum ATPase